MELIAVVGIVAIVAIVVVFVLARGNREPEPWTAECTSCVSGACDKCEAE